MRHTDAQIATLVQTVRSLRETLARINVVASPMAYDVATAALEVNTEALKRALTWPLTAESLYRRRVELPGGRYVEAFNSAGGTTVAVRTTAPEPGHPATESCFTDPSPYKPDRKSVV